ncbi:MAG: hypothetical protein ACI4XA_05065, partial [Oscillospiraceae bacterium]
TAPLAHAAPLILPQKVCVAQVGQGVSFVIFRLLFSCFIPCCLIFLHILKSHLSFFVKDGFFDKLKAIYFFGIQPLPVTCH